MDHQALAFQYFEHAYELWLDQYDEFAEANEELESRYGESLLRVMQLLVNMYQQRRMKKWRPTSRFSKKS